MFARLEAWRNRAFCGAALLASVLQALSSARNPSARHPSARTDEDSSATEFSEASLDSGVSSLSQRHLPVSHSAIALPGSLGSTHTLSRAADAITKRFTPSGRHSAGEAGAAQDTR